MIYVTKFRANDLNPSKGKQIEFNKGVVDTFFGFTKSQEDAEFECCSLATPTVKRKIKVHFTLSPARSDYKIYQNSDGSMDLKDYFLNVLHLTSANLSDYYAIKKVGSAKYTLFYVPNRLFASDFFKQLSADQLILMPDASTDAASNDVDGEDEKGTAQKIFYGCPGTGKSFKVKKRTEGLDGTEAIYFDEEGNRIETPATEDERLKTPSNIFRTTFHPDYDYATFVGTYKPIMKAKKDSDGKPTGEDELRYEFVPQVFTKAYVRAWKSLREETLEGKDKNVYLIIEEINRGNCAQIFGDLFQLLDRKDGKSEFPIIPSAEMSEYLSAQDVPSEMLRLPENLHIYATMNTSDQSLFPMDSAFKRRWAMEYVPIKYEGTEASDYKLNLYGTEYSWTEFLRHVNSKIRTATNSEDKQMGEFFIKKPVITEKEFINKVMFYIWNDVCKDLYSATRISNKYFLCDSKDTYFTFAELYSGRQNKGKDDTTPEQLIRGFMDYLMKEDDDKPADGTSSVGEDPMNQQQ